LPSFAQQRLWFLDQLEPGSAFYNMPAAVRLNGTINMEALERSLNEVVRRHEVLRTTFATVDGQPFQIIAPTLNLPLAVTDLRAIPLARREEEAQRLSKAEAQQPFDLAQGPLLRARLLRLDQDDSILIINMHHVVSDGWSLGIFIQEVAALYQVFSGGQPPVPDGESAPESRRPPVGRGAPLPELPVQYADYAVWQREWLQGEVLETQLDYWRKQLDNLSPLELPTDHPRPAAQAHGGTVENVALPAALSRALKTLSQQAGVTLFMTLLAVFDVLLSRYTGQTDISVGSPIANRKHAEMEGLIGFFVNTLVLRTDLTGNPSFRELLTRVNDVCLGAYAHQDVPFERLVEELHPARDLSRTPFFQVMFALQNASIDLIELPGLTLRPSPADSDTAKFDLTIFLTDTEQGLTGTVEYSTDLFEADTIIRLFSHFQMLLEAIVADPDRRIFDLPLLTSAEREQILVEWNTTEAVYPQDQCIHELFEAQAGKTPEAVALVFEDQQLTYRELNQHANQLAHYLRSQGVGPDVRVGICIERSLEMVVGLLGILKAGGAYVPLDPTYPQERLAYMLEDAKPAVLLTQQHLQKTILVNTNDIATFCIDNHWTTLESYLDSNPENITLPGNLAYVIYTSGSTGKPKGVQIEHRNLNNLISWHQSVFAISEQDKATQLAGFSFDAAGWEIWPYLTVGACLYMPANNVAHMSPKTVQEWLMSRKITVSFLPTPFAEVILPLEWPKDLSLRILLTGGDRLHLYPSADLPFTFYNNYGPTENTVVTTFTKISTSSVTDKFPSIGRPISNTCVYLLDKQLQPVPAGIPGELHIAGDSLARGYLDRSDLTADKFIPNLFSSIPGARMYKSGDLARYLPDGNIEYLGRIDSQIKIRGFRIELGEIEATLAALPEVGEVVVLAREDIPGDPLTGAGKRLVAYLVMQAGQSLPDVAALRSKLRQSLPDYMIPAYFIVLSALPLTPNGKIDRRALPAPDMLRSEIGYVAPRTSTEETLALIWANVLKLDKVGIHDNFFELGGHSLLATQVVSRIRQAFNTELSLRDFFQMPTVAELAETIRKNDENEILPILPVVRTGQHPLSFAQQRLWFLDQFESGSAFYNIPIAMRMVGELNQTALRRTLNEIVRRHEALRTSFATVDGAPSQVIAGHLELALLVHDLTELPTIEREARAQRLAQDEAQTPFDLSTGPLLRASLIRLDATDHIALFTMHHIVSDGWSMGVLVHEMAVLYAAYVQNQLPAPDRGPLPELTIQYVDFAHWQRQRLSGDVLQQQLDYWAGQLSGSPTLLTLPTDRPRPAMQSHRGALQSFEISAQTTAGLYALNKQTQTTLFMALTAAFSVLLSRYSGQNDLCIGAPIANRNRAEIEVLIGFFVNTLVLRTRIDSAASFESLLQQVRSTTLNAYAHQDVPFEQLVDLLKPERHTGHSPLFQVMLVLLNTPAGNFDLPGLTMQAVKTESTTAKFDLTLFVTEADRQLFAEFEYNTDLFDKATIERMSGHFTRLLDAIVANPNAPIWDFPMLGANELHQLLVEWNATETVYPREKCLHALFEDQAQKTPEAVAVIFDDWQLTYAELNRRANQLARSLQNRGVGPDVLVGICVKRSVEMLVGLLGILKAGGAYIPLDPTYSKERLAFMLGDSNVAVLLTQTSLLAQLSNAPAQIICLDTEWETIGQEQTTNLGRTAGPENLAYALYTSGSTGRPKGVQVCHRALVNFLTSMQAKPGLNPQETLLSVTTLSFDIAGLELYLPLLVGARTVIVSRDVAGDGAQLAARLAEVGATALQATPVTWRLLLDADWTPPPGFTALCGGEALPRELAEQLLSRGLTLWNMYGPTETTIWSTCSRVETGNGPVTIGCPIANTQIYILDAYLQPVPVGVAGELYIGGDGLARGYLNRPNLTADKFIPNPFSLTPGARMYKSGDLARYLPNAQIECLGRLDYQVKLRGFRIELGEIESVLALHPAVRQAVAVVREDHPGDPLTGAGPLAGTDKRLVAYFVPNWERYLAKPDKKYDAEQVSAWQSVWDEAYAQPESIPDPTFNIAGWNNSYTGRPIPASEMREWVNNTVDRICSLHPRRVLEIGCGTGLLLFRVAPACEKYLGVDMSRQALQSLQTVIDERGLSQVTLSNRTADDFTGIEPRSVDTVIINSVIQYFPSMDYLVQVLQSAVDAVSEGGSVYIGDVRSLPLLEAFHTSVQLAHLPPTASIAELRERVRVSLSQEKELVVAPDFFIVLKQHLPKVGWVEILPKLGSAQNELTRFRYDVVLHIGNPSSPSLERDWLTWGEQTTLSTLRQLLGQERPTAIGVRQIPNARVLAEAQIAAWLNDENRDGVVGEWLSASQELKGVEIGDLLQMSDETGYTLHLHWRNEAKSFDAIFRKRDSSSTDQHGRGDAAFPEEMALTKPWHEYARIPVLHLPLQDLLMELNTFIKDKLPEYMLPSLMMALEKMPLTPNGKIDRKALPAPNMLRKATGYVAPRSPAEETLALIWADVLKLDKVGIHDSFFNLGGHSLLATQVVSRLRQLFNVEISLRELFQSPTIAELAQTIQSAEKIRGAGFAPIPRPERIPLSFEQFRLWLVDQSSPGTAINNMFDTIRIRGVLDIEAFECAFRHIIQRHESLHTCFRAIDGEPYLAIDPNMPASLIHIDLSGCAPAEQQTEIRRLAGEAVWRAFDLANGPLFCGHLLRLSRDENILTLSMHHSIMDGWSMGILIEELVALYQAFSSGQVSPLPELTFQYADYVLWEHSRMQGETFERQMSYWKKQLAGIPDTLDLPTDYPRPATQNGNGTRLYVHLPQKLNAALQNLSREEGATLFMTLLAALQALLARYSDQTDIVIGSPIANRNQPEFENVVGFFVNNLLLRIDLSGDPSFRELLRRVRKAHLGAFEHQGIPYKKLIDELEINSDQSRNPLFQVMFVLQNIRFNRTLAIPDGLSLEEIPSETDTAQFDLYLSMQETDTDTDLNGYFVYDTGLFAPETMAFFPHVYRQILEGWVANPEQRLSEIRLPEVLSAKVEAARARQQKDATFSA
jgi:amino acid adenylation domain-containing protein